jgi:hypothetical protein
MAELVYMVEQEEQHWTRVLSCHATCRLAEAEVNRLIAKMPRESRDKWAKRPHRKSMSQNHGRTVMAWDARQFGPSTRQVSAFYITSFEVQGSAVDRLGELVQ